MTTTIHYSFLPHLDAEASLGFYRDLLEFEVRQDVGYENMRWITLGPANQPETSIVLTPPALDPNLTDTERDTILSLITNGQYAMLTLGSDDVDSLFTRLKNGGATVIQEPTDQDYGVRDCAFRDPAGNVIRINQT
ncbi:VOC family protein [Timonella sp. A28]|uniref:VOC family protein n=1 Tax=Timonella sp. A28 TaxID=3442640 RepID=UPI003EBA2657